MAHSCPQCWILCHCGGDIDDCRFDNTDEQNACTHCDGDYADYGDDGCEWGCCYPDKCCMPGEHMKNECHTAGDLIAQTEGQPEEA
jgi:hypothetical protein